MASTNNTTSNQQAQHMVLSESARCESSPTAHREDWQCHTFAQPKGVYSPESRAWHTASLHLSPVASQFRSAPTLHHCAAPQSKRMDELRHSMEPRDRRVARPLLLPRPPTVLIPPPPSHTLSLSILLHSNPLCMPAACIEARARYYEGGIKATCAGRFVLRQSLKLR